MKRFVFFGLFLGAAACLATGCGDDEPDGQGIETVTVSGAGGYAKTKLEADAFMFTDDERYRILTPPAYFSGFEMLIPSRGAHNGGYITPGSDGIVYILATQQTLPDGWFVLSGNGMTYAEPGSETAAALNVYCKIAYVGRPVEIPVLTGDIPVFPLARSIEYVPEP